MLKSKIQRASNSKWK